MATIRYLVNDTAEPVAFYTEELGFKLQNNFGPIAIIAKDGLALWCADPRDLGSPVYARRKQAGAGRLEPPGD